MLNRLTRRAFSAKQLSHGSSKVRDGLELACRQPPVLLRDLDEGAPSFSVQQGYWSGCFVEKSLLLPQRDYELIADAFRSATWNEGRQATCVRFDAVWAVLLAPKVAFS